MKKVAAQQREAVELSYTAQLSFDDNEPKF